MSKPINLTGTKKAIYILRDCAVRLGYIVDETDIDLDKTIKEIEKEADRLEKDLDKATDEKQPKGKGK